MSLPVAPAHAFLPNSPRGVVVHELTNESRQSARETLFAEIDRLGLRAEMESHLVEAGKAGIDEGCRLQVRLREDRLKAWMPAFDTLDLCQRLGLQTRTNLDDLAREIWLTLLASPIALDFPSAEELLSAVRMRQFIVQAARQTAMDFHTTEANRPTAYWLHSEDSGFILRPGQPLIEALEQTTQPQSSGALYSFSCYRATEYVILLAIAREARASNPALLAALQAQWEQRAVMSGRFHEVFLREYGSMEDPLPIGYYVPGDRIWFRNPDDASSDVAGFEGSWVFYLGNGQFPNFWRRNKPFTLLSKCVEVYHWRHATWTAA